MKHKKVPRRRIQRAFYLWLMASYGKFAIPVTVSRRRDLFLECRLAGITSALKITLTSYDLVVAAEINGECWDLLACFEADPKKIQERYECSLCDPETRSTHLSREAIWRDGIFEPFLNWVNDTLAKCEWLAFYQNKPSGSSWAKIGMAPDKMESEFDCLYSVVPLILKESEKPIR